MLKGFFQRSDNIHERIAISSIRLCFAFLFLLFFKEPPKESMTLINTFGGIVFTAGFATVYNYLYGSSKKQADPGETITKQTTLVNSKTE